MKVSFEGIGENVVTFYNSQSNAAAAGNAVKMSGNGEVGACSDGDRIAGLCLSSDGDYAAVQICGYVSMPYTGAAPSAGFAKLSAAGVSALKVDGTNGAEKLVIDVDASAKTVGFML